MTITKNSNERWWGGRWRPVWFMICVVVAGLVVVENHSTPGAQNGLPKSRAEMTDFAETSRYQDVMGFLDGIQRQSPLVKVTSFATTSEGRALPLVILSDPPVYHPTQALASNKLIVFVMANIHAGEVEGKEASQHLIRDIASGPLRRLLSRLIILFAPIYNADGNERISPNNRRNQKGPPAGVGIRETAQGLDLNRDYMKLETPEANGLVQNVLHRWNPHLTVDLHTTNGSYHGYALTYAPPLNPNGHPAPIAFVREKMLPGLTRRMDKSYRYKTYFYGNFLNENDPGKGWQTFDHRPRFGNNYVGLRNRMTILSEAYAYLDFRRRVDVTQKFVQTILEYSAERATEMMDILRRAESETLARGAAPKPSDQLGVAFKVKPLDRLVDILAYKVVAEGDGASDQKKYRRTDEIVSYRMQDFGLFEATRKLSIPRAYLLPLDQQPIVKKLLAHGIAVEELTGPLTAEVEAFIVQEVKLSERSFQKHREARLVGRYETRSVPFAPGSFWVTLAQPSANLIFYLLEAESDDGLVTWNSFDEYLASHRQSDGTSVYPVYRVHQVVTSPRRVLSTNERP